MKKISPFDPWADLAAFSNPVPADVGAALHLLGVEAVRELSREGSTEYLALCPGHLAVTGKADRRPAFSVNSSTGLFLCFSCGYAGTFIDLVEDILGLARVDAFRWIARQGVYRVHEEEERDGPPPDEPRITEASLALFVPPPRDALLARRLTQEACEVYGVLWCPEKRHWILPIRDPDTGALWGWQEKGKQFFRNFPAGVKKSRTLFGPLTWTGETALLQESPLDAVRGHALGFEGSFASYGAHVSEAQMRILKACCRSLILGLDNDSAGITARTRIYDRWRPRGLPMKFLEYRHTAGVKDLGEMGDADARLAYTGAYLPWRERRR